MSAGRQLGGGGRRREGGEVLGNRVLPEETGVAIRSGNTLPLSPVNAMLLCGWNKFLLSCGEGSRVAGEARWG